MANKRELAPRVLRELGILAAGEAGAADDLSLAEEKIEAVHSALKADRLLRWTLNDVPDFAEEPYVLMAAFLAAKSFERQPDPVLWSIGLRQIQAGVSLGPVAITRAEYY